jgi:hypothetical protein
VGGPLQESDNGSNLVNPARGHRIEARRPGGRHEAGAEADAGEEHGRADHRYRIVPFELIDERAVIFNMPRAIEVMFYSPYVAYTRMPVDDDVRMLRSRGIPIVIYEPAGTTVAVPADWGALVLRGRFE